MPNEAGCTRTISPAALKVAPPLTHVLVHRDERHDMRARDDTVPIGIALLVFDIRVAESRAVGVETLVHALEDPVALGLGEAFVAPIVGHGEARNRLRTGEAGARTGRAFASWLAHCEKLPAGA